MKKKHLIKFFSIILLFGFFQSYIFAATELASPKALPDFKLATDNGVFTKKNLQGRWSILYFGFTRCPMICPTTMKTLKETYTALEKKLPAEKLPQIVMISVDAKSDNAAIMKQYVKKFNPHFVGVAGDEKAITALTDAVGILFLVFQPDKNKHDYTIDHSNTLLLINPKGELAAIFSAPYDTKDVIDGYELITRNQR